MAYIHNFKFSRLAFWPAYSLINTPCSVPGNKRSGGYGTEDTSLDADHVPDTRSVGISRSSCFPYLSPFLRVVFYPENNFSPGWHRFCSLPGPRGAAYGSASGSGGVPGLFGILVSEAGLGHPVLGPALAPRLRQGCSTARTKSLAPNKCQPVIFILLMVPRYV